VVVVVTVVAITDAKIILLFAVPMSPIHFKPPPLAIKPAAELTASLPTTTVSDLNGNHAYFIFNLME
jgi:hypothetical protein